jgi:peptide deformylase
MNLTVLNEKYRDIIKETDENGKVLYQSCLKVSPLILADGIYDDLPKYQMDVWELVTYNLSIRDNAIGLAANQIDLPWRVIAIRDEAGVVTMFNPEIVATEGGLVNSIEGCLSCPGAKYKLKRHKRVTIQ